MLLFKQNVDQECTFCLQNSSDCQKSPKSDHTSLNCSTANFELVYSPAGRCFFFSIYVWTHEFFHLVGEEDAVFLSNQLKESVLHSTAWTAALFQAQSRGSTFHP